MDALSVHVCVIVYKYSSKGKHLFCSKVTFINYF